MGAAAGQEARFTTGLGRDVFIASQVQAGPSWTVFPSKLGRERTGRELTVYTYLVGVKQYFGYFTYSIPSITTLKKGSMKIIITTHMDWNRLRECNTVKRTHLVNGKTGVQNSRVL